MRGASGNAGRFIRSDDGHVNDQRHEFHLARSVFDPTSFSTPLIARASLTLGRSDDSSGNNRVYCAGGTSPSITSIKYDRPGDPILAINPAIESSYLDWGLNPESR